MIADALRRDQRRLRWCLGADPGGGLHQAIVSADQVFTSRLTLIEAERVIVRQVRAGDLTVVQAQEAREVLAAAFPNWAIVDVIVSVCERAAEAFPVEPVRALDAIHLATALLVADLAGGVAVLSTDRRIRENADRLGLACLGA